MPGKVEARKGGGVGESAGELYYEAPSKHLTVVHHELS